MGKTVAHKLIESHLMEGEMVVGQEIGLKIDRIKGEIKLIGHPPGIGGVGRRAAGRDLRIQALAAIVIMPYAHVHADDLGARPAQQHRRQRRINAAAHRDQYLSALIRFPQFHETPLNS